ncbi:hypothetical protein WN943_022488 [Citrus x changshan-huyou]
MELNRNLMKAAPPLLEEDRTTKKARFREQGSDENNPPIMSFRDSLMKDQSGAAVMNECVDDIDIVDEDVIIETNGCIPSVVFSQKMQEQLWSPSFDYLSDKIETVVAWIRLPGMPLHYYHKRVLRILGEVVGRVTRIDYNTEAAKRGKFARVAVEICLNKPLVSQFQLNGKIQRIEYQGLPTICFECGKYGHTIDTCQSKQELPRGQGCDGVYQPKGEATEVTVDPATVDNPKNSLFGPWMIVAKKGRPRKAKEGTIQGDYNRAQNGNIQSGSRFSLLNSEDNMDNEREINEMITSNHTLEISLDLQDENQNSNQSMQPNHRYSLRKHIQRSNHGNIAHPPSPSLVQLRPRPPHANHADQNKLLSPAMHNINPTLASIQNHGDEDSEGSTYVTRGGTDESRDDSESGGSLEEETDMELELQAHTLRALAPEFRRTFKALIQKYNPSMVALFEPRISGKKTDKFIIRSGFERSHRIEAEGFSGGIWLMWKDYVKVENDLEAVTYNVSGPWLIGGDFTTILHPSEMRGGSTSSNGVCHQFSDLFHQNQFCDLDFSGPKFTWERGNLLKRLDRSFCNDEWVQKFANSQVMHLPKLDSDHRPILVKFDRASRQASGAKPFRFLASWLTDGRFKTFVSETWRGSGDYVNSAGHFITEVRKWNKETPDGSRGDPQEGFGEYFESGGGFVNLYTKELGEHIPYPLVSMFPRVDEMNLGKLNAEVCEDDIREGIFKGHQIPSEINKTLIVLIPKVEHLDSLRLYRPISLCPVIYKIITKIVANILKGILFELIGPTETSFVPGRHITENIIIAQEVIHTMRRKSGKIGQMLIKVDLEKAYDRLTSIQILWNGECTEEFVPSRGIRQGDLISPYIFVLCIERLSHGIHRAINTGTWRPIRLFKRGTLITHVFFAEASCTQAAVINDVLNTFCMSSGAKVNKQKSQVFFSKNVKPCNVRNIGTTLQFSVTTDLGNYLGMSLSHSRVSKATYHGILENVERKLNGWSAKFLSFAGRVTLTQFVL